MEKIQIKQLPRILDLRGNLTFIENREQIPFSIARVFWTYDVPSGQTRGGHAYYKQNELIIALSGSFDVVVTKKDKSKEVYSLNRSYFGLLVPAGTWRHLENFSTNALSLHLSDMFYCKDDYIRKFEDFLNMYDK